MSRRASAFRQIDVSRACRGAAAAGVEISKVEIDTDGKIVIVARNGDQKPASELAKWKAQRDARQAQGH
jgi:hypothetical protein